MITGSSKDADWSEGVITEYNPQKETIVIGEYPGKQISVKEVPKAQKDKIKISSWATVWFKKGEKYFARSIMMLAKSGFDKSGSASSTKKEVKMIEDLLKEDPFYGNEIYAKLNESEKERLLKTFNHNLDVAARIFAVSSTYEESKQDMDKIVATITELAAQLTVIADNNSHQFLKSKIPKEKA